MLYDGHSTPPSPPFPGMCSPSPSTACRRTTVLRLPRRLAGGFRRQAPRQGITSRGLDMLASMRLCANVRPARHPDRPGRLPEHRRPGGRRRAHAPPARRGLGSQRHPRRPVRQAKGDPLHVPRLDPRFIPSGRPGFRPNCCGRKRFSSFQGRLQLAHPDHFRLVFLPTKTICGGHQPRRPFLEGYRKRHGTHKPGRPLTFILPENL